MNSIYFLTGAHRLADSRTPRAFTCIALASALFAFGPATLHAEFVPSRYPAVRVATPPTIDGDLSDPAWLQAAEMPNFYAYQSGGKPPAAATTARILWDDAYLYVGFQMSDAEIRSSCGWKNICGRDASLFQGDVVELFIRPSENSTRYYEFEWSPLAEIFDAAFNTRFGAPGTSWNTTIRAAAKVDGSADDPSDVDRSWSIEASIPLADVQPGGVNLGDQWRFTVTRYDYFNVPPRSSPALMMSTKGDPAAAQGGASNGFHSYEIYDVLEFVESVPEPQCGSLWLFGALALAHRRGDLYKGGGLRRGGRTGIVSGRGRLGLVAS